MTADKIMSRHCPICSKAFTPAAFNPGQVYCSKRCGLTGWRREKASAVSQNDGGERARNSARVLTLSSAIHEALALHDGSKTGPAADRIVRMTYELSQAMKECPPGTRAKATRVTHLESNEREAAE